MDRWNLIRMGIKKEKGKKTKKKKIVIMQITVH